MRIACATASHISLAICRTHYVQSNAQHCPRKTYIWGNLVPKRHFKGVLAILSLKRFKIKIHLLLNCSKPP